jgi:hypothetical protein
MTSQPSHRDLVRAYVDLRRYEDKHADLADFYTRRYRALSTILGLDLTEPPPLDPDDTDRSALHRVFEEVAQFCCSISSPFSGYVEAPARLVQIAAPYEERFRVHATEQRELGIGLLSELADAIYGPCERRVPPGELERLGLADSQAPELDDYF